MARGSVPRSAVSIAALVLVLCGTPLPAAAQGDGIPELLASLQRLVLAGEPDAYLRLLSPVADRVRAASFASGLDQALDRVVVRERDRRPLGTSGSGLRLMVEVFSQRGTTGRIETWRLDVRRKPQGPDGVEGAVPEWMILNQEILTTLQGLIQLSLNTSTQYAATNFSVLSEDFELKLPTGSVFVVESMDGITGLVLLGRGEMVFSPSAATERGQLRIFCGQETLVTAFETAFVRLNPAEVEARITRQALQARVADPRDVRRAEAVFREESEKSFIIDLSDISEETWSLQPPLGDFVAEVRTRRYKAVTYAHSGSEHEDISLFDRENKRTISIYPSQQKLASRGRFYDEDSRSDYDVLDHYIDATFDPERASLQARTRLRLRMRSPQVASLSIRLADSLAVRSVASDELGRLMHLRVRNQNTVIVNLPTALGRDQVLTLNITYDGPIEAQPPDREAVQVRIDEDLPRLPNEPSFLYSNRAFWYPQAMTTDYATATLRLTVPAAFGCVASGELVPGSPVTVGIGPEATKVYVFVARQPVRYLATIISRFVRVATSDIGLAPPPAPERSTGTGTTHGAQAPDFRLTIESNPRQQSRALSLTARAAEIVRFYTSLVGDTPYPAFTVALVENQLPGGHSPAYFAALNQPQVNAGVTWRHDPASFGNFPEFFLAHEVAHQWWGQAVGWKNFHEQWLSEGFAQYFAALYGREQRGDEVFLEILRQFRRWAIAESDEGPVYLGYRLGHVKNNGRIFRALVYNKGAAILHMLRRMVGDEPFFRALRRFYTTFRFQKAGTDDLRRVFEAETGVPLARFFERWIYEDRIPRVRFRWQRTDGGVVVRFEQPDDFHFPVTVRLEHGDGTTTHSVAIVDGRFTEHRVDSLKPVRNVLVNQDESTLAHFERGDS
jgi:hypothetical protein